MAEVVGGLNPRTKGALNHLAVEGRMLRRACKKHRC